VHVREVGGGGVVVCGGRSDQGWGGAQDYFAVLLLVSEGTDPQPRRMLEVRGTLGDRAGPIADMASNVGRS